MIEAAVCGDHLDYLEALDRVILERARHMGAVPMLFSPIMSVDSLQRMNHFDSFPHLTTMISRLDMAASGSLMVQPATESLTTAACYPIYAGFQGRSIDEPMMVTTRNTCFRLEESLTPLERQWAFTMREVVYLGSHNDAAQFADDDGRKLLDDLATQLQLEVVWVHAQDPFFEPTSGPALLQLTEPVKFELVFKDRLALGSTNRHHDHFGRAFAMTYDEQPVETACVAFGLERWLAAVIETYGPDAENWPAL